MTLRFAHRIVRKLGDKDAEMSSVRLIDVDSLICGKSFTRLFARLEVMVPSCKRTPATIIQRMSPLQMLHSVRSTNANGNRFPIMREQRTSLYFRQSAYSNKRSHLRLDGLLKAHHKELRFSGRAPNGRFETMNSSLRNFPDNVSLFWGCSRSQGPIFGSPE